MIPHEAHATCYRRSLWAPCLGPWSVERPFDWTAREGAGTHAAITPHPELHWPSRDHPANTTIHAAASRNLFIHPVNSLQCQTIAANLDNLLLPAARLHPPTRSTHSPRPSFALCLTDHYQRPRATSVANHGSDHNHHDARSDGKHAR